MKILVADDHPFFREGFGNALTDLQAGIVITEADSGEAALEAVQQGGFDLVFLDLLMPGMHGFECIDKMKAAFPELRVVVVSGLEQPKDIQNAFRHGATGYLPKTLHGDVMRNALRLVLAGGTYLPPAALKGAEKTSAGFGGCTPETLADGIGKLTPRQHEVFTRLGEGKSNREIAAELGLSVSTVKIYVTGVLKALQISNRTQAGILASKKTGP